MKLQLPKTLLRLIVLCYLIFFNLNSYCQNPNNEPLEKVKSKDWTEILDKDLTQWEVFTGVPDKSVVNIPASYKKEPNGDHKQPLGLGDPMGIFKVISGENGEPILHISGEVYAGLTSKKEYKDYHLTLSFKWGENKFEPRLERKRDNGVLYHCKGEHGAFWNVWKSSLEFQIQEGDFGDLYNLAGPSSKVTINKDLNWDPTSEIVNKTIHTKRSIDAESPRGEWTRIDLYVLGDKAIHVTNGKVVLALSEAKSKNGEILNSGQIQIQSEGAECFMKDINIRPIKKFPKKILKDTY